MQVPSDIVYFLQLREGVKGETYLDSLGKPTAGMGHLLTPEEFAEYPVGDAIPYPVIDKWAAQDSLTAYTAALDQAKRLKVTSPEFIKVLTSVNFQNGSHWFLKFPKTWALMLAGKWAEACTEVHDSLWAKQTPVRVADFQSAMKLNAEATA